MTKDRITELSATIEVVSNATTVSIQGIVARIRDHLRKKRQTKEKFSIQEQKDETINWINENIKKIKITEYINREGEMDTKKITERIFDEIFNYGVLQKAMEDEDISEIRANGKQIKIEKNGRVQDLIDENGNIAEFSSPEEQNIIINKLSQYQMINGKDALVNARTVEGFRIAIVDSSAMTKTYKKGFDGYRSFVLRKFKSSHITIIDEVKKYHSLSDGMARFMKLVVNTQTFVSIGVTNSGKSVDEDTKMITPKGVILAKDLKKGDVIYDGNGKETRVMGVYPQGVLRAYKIVFSDNSFVIVSKDHINRVWKDGKPLDITTEGLIEINNISKQQGNNKIDELGNYYIKRPDNLPLSNKYKKWVNIKKIEDLDIQKEMICFMVDSEDHTYLVNDYIPTHNTTLNRAFLDYINNDRRVIFGQYPAEIDLRRIIKNSKGEYQQINDVLMMDAELETGEKRTTSNTMENIMTHILRLSPEIVGINEVRSPKEFHTLTQIALAGHKINTSFHAKDAKDAMIRYTNAYITESKDSFEVALMTITSSINFVVMQHKMQDGTRKTLQIAEVIGSDGNIPLVNDIYVFEPTNTIKEGEKVIEIQGIHKKVGKLSERARKEMMLAGYTQAEIDEVDYEPGSIEETYTGENIIDESYINLEQGALDKQILVDQIQKFEERERGDTKSTYMQEEEDLNNMDI